MSEAYCRVIDMIAVSSLDYRDVVIKLAKANPSALLMIIDHIDGADESAKANDLNTEIGKAFSGDGSGSRKVEAIKRCRALTGWGLYEAKKYVDALVEGVAPPVPLKTHTLTLNDKLTRLFSPVVGGGGVTPGQATYPDEGAF